MYKQPKPYRKPRRHRWLFLVLILVFVYNYIDVRYLSLARGDSSKETLNLISKRLKENVERLTQQDWKGRQPGTKGGLLAAQWIREKVKTCGMVSSEKYPDFFQQLPEDLGPNIIALSKKRTEEGAWIVLGAHYDHLGPSGPLNSIHYGADDNASAVAILLEIACDLPKLSKSKMALVFYNTEEPPYTLTPFMGSEVFASQLPPEIDSIKNISLSITLDLMGGSFWKKMNESLAVVGGSTGEGLRELILKTKYNELNILDLDYHAIEKLPTGQRTRVSDYHAFIRRGVPSLFLTTGRTLHYHRASDRADTLDYMGMVDRKEWIKKALVNFDGYSGAFVEGDPFDYEAEKDSLLKLLKFAKNWRTRIPGTSFWSRKKFSDEYELLKSGSLKSKIDQRTLIENVVQRFQCLMMDVPLCFLL